MYCARLSRERDGEIADLLHAPLDWDYVLAAAEDHGMTMLLHRHLDGGLEGSVPQGVMDRLRGVSRANKLQNLMLVGELIRILRLFEQNDISAIPYKGPTLAAAVYGDFALRSAGDLDILIQRRDVPKAKEILLSMGYEPTPWLTNVRLTPAQEAAFLRFEREYNFTRRDTGVSVELQWEVIPKYFSFSLGVESLRTRKVSIGGGALPTLVPEDLLLVLCVHGAKHFFERLIWICDVAETVNVHPEMDWDDLLTRASAAGSRRMLLLGLALAHDLLRTRLPDEVLQIMKSDPAVEVLAGGVREKLFREPDGTRGVFDESVFHPFHYNARERRRDRVGYLLRAVTTPNESDWMERPLPEKLFPLYYVMKPLRLARKYGRRLSKRASR